VAVLHELVSACDGARLAPPAARTEGEPDAGREEEERSGESSHDARRAPADARPVRVREPPVGRVPRHHQNHRDSAESVEREDARSASFERLRHTHARMRTATGIRVGASTHIARGRRFELLGRALTPIRRSATEAVLRPGPRHWPRTLFTRRAVFKSICIFTGHANPALAEQIASYLEVPLGRAKISTFADGEVFAEVQENVRGVDVYVVQPTCAPVNDHLMQLLVMIDALKRASAGSITAVIPYYGYARQDRKVAPRTPITAKLVADLLQSAGASRVVSMDLHAGQIQGFFNIPFDHLYAMPVFLDYLRPRLRPGSVCVSPDAGGVERARAYAKRLGSELAIIDKRRPSANVSEVMNIVGAVEGRDCVIVDDMIDTAGTLTNAAKALMDRGAKRVFACATHAVLSGPAVERIRESVLEEVIVTDTIPLRAEAKQVDKFKVLSVSRLLGEAIKRIHNSDSVSSLFV
jgi:ribose-phosphate pyrophosphokinase